MSRPSADPPATEPAPAAHWVPGRWFSRGAFAAIDQALFSASNFLIVLLLGRWLDPADFGRLAVAHSLFLLLSTVYMALSVDAMLIYGPRDYRQQLPRYLGALLAIQTPVGLGIALVLALVGAGMIAFGATDLGLTVLAMGLASPFILLLWMARRPSYITLAPRRAAIAAAAYLILVTAALWVAWLGGWLSAYSGIAIMAGASGGVATGLLWIEKVALPRPLRKAARDPIVRSAARDHWNYGKWATASGLLGILPTQLAYLLLPIFSDVQDSGALRAASNLILPLIQLNMAVGLLLLPALSSSVGTDARRTGRLLIAAGAVAVVMPAIAWLILSLVAEPILRLCYGDHYAVHAWLIGILGAVPPLLGASLIVNTYLQSRKRQDAVFYSSLASAGCALTLGTLLIGHDGLRGAAVGVCASLVVAIVVSLTFALSRPQRPLNPVLEQEAPPLGG